MLSTKLTLGAIAALALVGGSNAAAMELTDATFDAEVASSGKSSFVKFYAPWCGHCKAIAPAWKQLGEAFADNEDVIIGEVDCTKEESTCQKYGVQGYPTLKYFTGATAATGDAYQGGRDFEALKAFATESLGPTCGAENIDLCDADQKKVIAEKQALAPEALDAEIEGLEGEIKKAGDDLDELLKSLQAQYEAGKKAKDDTVAAISPKMALVRSVQRANVAKTTEAKTEL